MSVLLKRMMLIALKVSGDALNERFKQKMVSEKGNCIYASVNTEIKSWKIKFKRAR